MFLCFVFVFILMDALPVICHPGHPEILNTDWTTYGWGYEFQPSLRQCLCGSCLYQVDSNHNLSLRDLCLAHFPIHCNFSQTGCLRHREFKMALVNFCNEITERPALASITEESDIKIQFSRVPRFLDPVCRA